MSKSYEERNSAIAKQIEWSDAMDAGGKRDAMGHPFTSWLVAVYQPNGHAARDIHGRQIYETQADFKARQQPARAPIGQTLSLF